MDDAARAAIVRTGRRFQISLNGVQALDLKTGKISGGASAPALRRPILRTTRRQPLLSLSVERYSWAKTATTGRSPHGAGGDHMTAAASVPKASCVFFTQEYKR